MPPDRGRAGKACSACRKQKTRCYPGEKSNGACLRCSTLRQRCSFTEERAGEDEDFDGETTKNSRLDRLEGAVNLILERLSEGGPRHTTEHRSPTPARARAQEETRESDHRSRGTSLDEDGVAPVFVLRDLAAESGNVNGQNVLPLDQEDLVESGVLSQSDAIILVRIFQEHYGRWVAFDSTTSPDALLHTIRKSPLLLCACCLIAVRHYSLQAAQNLAPTLFDKSKALLSAALLVSSQKVEFFLAVIILSMWSTTVGQNPLGIDSWLITGFALQHCFATKVFQHVIRGNAFSQSRHFIDRLRIFNHLVLVHLHYCCGTRRRSVIGKQHIDRSKEILKSDHATNFEQRMVAEIHLYWIIYENCTGASLDLPKVQGSLREWKRQWTFVLQQPRSQFLEMGHHFAQLLAYERALKSRSARVRDSLLNEMVKHSVAIMNLAMDNADDRTAHLSDHIYHIKTFAAVTLCRLLHLYEHQLILSHNIAELDNLILRFSAWLKTIGLPCHTGYTLGLTVAAFHKKLRPNAQPPLPLPTVLDLPAAGEWSMESFVPSFLPDILDTEVSPGGNWEWVADWEPMEAFSAMTMPL